MRSIWCVPGSISFCHYRANDVPNIAVDSSNFQDDKSNNQEKNFNKEAYSVLSPPASCSSSDEEENTRMPGASGGSASGNENFPSCFVSDNMDYGMDEQMPQNTQLVKHGKSKRAR